MSKKNGFKRGNGGNGETKFGCICCICHTATPSAVEMVDIPGRGVAEKSCLEREARLKQIKIPTEAAVAVKSLSLQ